MKDIVEKLKAWREDTLFDMEQDWPTPQEKTRMLRQSTQLSIAIGLLEGIGLNANIPLTNPPVS
jgi:hypothetical protein